jgi:hypothetical protein
MIYLKNIPVGIDSPIQQFQQFLYDQLKKKWKVSDTEYDSYGRCYRNQTDAGYVPEVFVSSDLANNTVYKPALFDDTINKAVSFFDVGSVVKYDNGTSKATVYLIFMVNVALIKPTLQHRGDEEIRRDVELLCSMRRFNFTLNEFMTGYKNVFNDFDGWLKADQVTFRDLHPLHCFRLGFDLIYGIQDC